MVFQLKTFNPELSFDIKENIILNVGRQDENKNTKVLVSTFAKGAGASFDHGDLAALEANMRQVMSEPQLSQRAFELNRAYALAELPYEKQVLRLESLLKVRGQINGK